MEQGQKSVGYRSLNAAVLKWTAIITMLIDHIGASLLAGLARANHGWGTGVRSRDFYYATRIIGRLAFPIFCFLLIEGLYHTRSRGKYLLRLGLFALISEIPFDFALNGTWWSFSGGQNVFFTLALGLAVCAIWDRLTDGNHPDCNPFGGICAVVTAVAAFYVAERLHTDYGGLGVALIIVMYLLRDKAFARDLLAGCVLCLMFLISNSHWIEVFGILSFPLLHLYNGERGRQNKYFFYVFYPAHLLVLTGILALMIRF